MRVEVQIIRLESTRPRVIIPGEEPLVKVTAVSPLSEDIDAEITWLLPAGLAPNYNDRFIVRIDWLDPSSDEPIGVTLEDEACAWIEAHPDRALGIAQDALGLRRSK